MKVYLSNINESWIVDRIRKEWYKANSDISTKMIIRSEIIWIISPWLWEKIPRKYLKEKKVICSHYHFDFSNFDRKNFYDLDQYVDEYHVISKKTQEQLEQLTAKKITSIPFWINQNLFFEIQNKKKLREELGFNDEDYLVGSFQRDTEGSGSNLPKLIKGPDIFYNLLTKNLKNKKNLKVVLAGKRRNYIIQKLEQADVPFKYFEMVNTEKLNKLYNILDLYIVSSRIEGGPQAILECAISKTPILSTNVGVAPEILHPSSIYNSKNFDDAKINIEYAYDNAALFKLPKGMNSFRKMLFKIYEN